MHILTEEDINNIMTLAGVLATKRVRRFAYTKRIGAPRESDSGTQKAVKNAERELKAYLQFIKDGSYYITDDAIEGGREGYVVVHGHPYTAIGVCQFTSLRFGDCVDYVKARIEEGEPVYRVKLARRHGAHSVKLINVEKA